MIGHRWTCVRTDRAVNVIPEFDLIEHREDASCPCRPSIEWENHADRPLIGHFAWDGRPEDSASAVKH